MPIDPKMIDAFKAAVQEVFTTMLNVPVTLERAGDSGPADPHSEVCGIIAFTGPVTGRMILNLSTASASKLITSFIGAEIEPDNPDFSDAIGELANMVAGAAKAKFGTANVTIAPPSVVMGHDYKVMSGRDDSSAVLDGKFDGGTLFVVLSLNMQKKAA